MILMILRYDIQQNILFFILIFISTLVALLMPAT